MIQKNSINEAVVPHLAVVADLENKQMAVISLFTNAQSAGLRSLVAAESGLQQPMQRMCNM